MIQTFENENDIHFDAWWVRGKLMRLDSFLSVLSPSNNFLLYIGCAFAYPI